ncbi:hypothetical protein I543_1069 [Mycobacteroides abscessus 21]|uniref:Uncharacterized protein n=1 Tax=Mycobacteroides abscessus 21 TaxID=1299324 RepID=A0A829Q0C7_9MYCO|nr:hypothetical protein I543_1069 [Mycobacteroides abscessus 21]
MLPHVWQGNRVLGEESSDRKQRKASAFGHFKKLLRSVVRQELSLLLKIALDADAAIGEAHSTNTPIALQHLAELVLAKADG